MVSTKTTEMETLRKNVEVSTNLPKRKNSEKAL